MHTRGALVKLGQLRPRGSVIVSFRGAAGATFKKKASGRCLFFIRMYTF